MLSIKHTYFVKGSCAIVTSVDNSCNSKKNSYSFQIVITCMPENLIDELKYSLTKNIPDSYVEGQSLDIKDIIKLD